MYLEECIPVKLPGRSGERGAQRRKYGHLTPDPIWMLTSIIWIYCVAKGTNKWLQSSTSKTQANISSSSSSYISYISSSSS